MKILARALSVLALSALAVPGGCMQMEQGTTLFPDGSGKITMKIAFKKSMLKMLEGFAKGFGADPGADPPAAPTDPLQELTNPESLAKNSEGIAAWKIGKKEEEGEWIRLTNVGYFEDVNKVKIYQTQQQPGAPPGEKTLAFAAKYEKTADGYVLRLTDDSRKELGEIPGAGPGAPGAADAELGKAMLEMMKPMLQDLKVTLSITVPGPIQEAQGFLEKKERTAVIAFDGA